MRKIFFKAIDTSDKFPDGRIKLKVIFEDRTGSKYEWIPKWKEEVLRLVDEASEVERINKPESEYLNAFAEVAKKIFGRLPPMKAYLRVGKLIEVKDNKLIVTTPGFINNYEVYRTVPEIEVDTLTGIKELNIGFKLTNEIVSKLLGKNIVLWIINDIVVKIGDADTGTILNDLETYP